MTYNPSTDAGTVRMLINDVDEADHVFLDSEITRFLSLEGGSIKRAAAQALDTIADSEVLVSKVIRSQDLSTDGAKVADALHKRADTLRAQAAAEEAATADETITAFDVIDFDPYPLYAAADYSG